MPNAWDAGSARMLAAAGFPAIATTSAGIAFSLGRQDYRVTNEDRRVSREAMFERISEIVEAVDVPVNGDLEAGYGTTPEQVAETIRLAIDAGLAGANIEDRNPASEQLFENEAAIERIVAARETIDAMDPDFVLTARSDALVDDPASVSAAVARSNAYIEAGAHCAYTPGTANLMMITTLAREIHGPLNMVLGLGSREGDARSWIEAGVQRVSLGGTIARAALGLVRAAALELRKTGTLSFAAGQISQAELNTMFAQGETGRK